MNLAQKLAANGSNAKLQRVSKWKTINHTAVAGDESFGLTIGTEYVLWIAQSDFETKSGSQVTKGEWFAVEKGK